jgi:L-amino acid N-acyltransferase YncA
VLTSLRRLHRDGVDEVGAVITDGNLASERLFARLGFSRVGPWG